MLKESFDPSVDEQERGCWSGMGLGAGRKGPGAGGGKGLGVDRGNRQGRGQEWAGSRKGGGWKWAEGRGREQDSCVSLSL